MQSLQQPFEHVLHFHCPLRGENSPNDSVQQSKCDVGSVHDPDRDDENDGKEGRRALHYVTQRESQHRRRSGEPSCRGRERQQGDERQAIHDSLYNDCCHGRGETRLGQSVGSVGSGQLARTYRQQIVGHETDGCRVPQGDEGQRLTVQPEQVAPPEGSQRKAERGHDNEGCKGERARGTKVSDDLAQVDIVKCPPEKGDGDDETENTRPPESRAASPFAVSQA
jgi:hypothetical protein